MVVLCVAAPCSLVTDVSEVFFLMIEKESTSKTSVNLYQTARLNTIANSHLLVCYLCGLNLPSDSNNLESVPCDV
jgi:hypothetical protein